MSAIENQKSKIENPITVPRLGWSMEEGTFAGWLKQDGDTVKPGDPLFILEGEKAAQDIESLDGGTLRIPRDAPRVGQVVKVGQVLGYLETASVECRVSNDAPLAAAQGATEQRATGGSSASVAADVPSLSATERTGGQAARGTQSSDAVASPAVRRLARERGVDLTAVSASGNGGRVTAEDILAAGGGANGTRSKRLRISPRARRVARELGIDPTRIAGSGRGGRIRERDVRGVASEDCRVSSEGGQPSSKVPTTTEGGQLVPLTALRRTIAARMVAATQQAAPVTLHSDADATNLVGLREQFKAAAANDAAANIPSNTIPSYTDFLVKLSAAALALHPALTRQWRDDGLFQPDGTHIAVAVDTEAGLLAPVIRHVDRLSLRQSSRELARLAGAARAGKLNLDELQGGVFTITNLGAQGIDHFTPILNLPQSAILGVGRIRPQPRLIDGQFVPRSIISLSLTFDHRVTDGAPAARFLQALARCIEQPAPWLL